MQQVNFVFIITWHSFWEPEVTLQEVRHDKLQHTRQLLRTMQDKLQVLMHEGELIPYFREVANNVSLQGYI